MVKIEFESINNNTKDRFCFSYNNINDVIIKMRDGAKNNLSNKQPVNFHEIQYTIMEKLLTYGYCSIDVDDITYNLIASVDGIHNMYMHI